MQLEQTTTHKVFALLVIFILCLSVSWALEPPCILTGIVLNKVSGEPLPSATIRVVGYSKGTISNAEGSFRIVLAPGSYTVAVSFVGFLTDTVSLQLKESVQTQNFSLQPSVVPMPEVNIYGDELNPAEEIILKAIQKKKKSLSQLQSYNFKSYSKTIFRIEKKSENRKDTIIVGLLETQADGMWQAPDHYKEIISARRQTINFSSNQNIFTVGRMPNFNDDEISIEAQSVVGPTSPNALEYYSFTMIDTLSIDNLPVYRIRMTPKSNVTPLFSGTIFIAGKTYLVMTVDVTGNEALDLAPMKDLHIHQQFALYENTFWLPILSATTVTIQFSPLPTATLFCEQTSQMYDYAINKEFPEGTFDSYILTTLPAADKRDSLFWSSANLLPLTREEMSAYSHIDSMMNHSSAAAKSIMFLTQMPIWWQEKPFTDGSDFYHFNRVEGSYVGVGLKLPPVLSMNPTIKTGYGISDKKAKYDFTMEHRFTQDGQTSIGVGIHNKVQFREDYGYSTSSLTLLALLEKNDPVDYFQSKGWIAYSQIRLFPNTGCRLTYLDEQQHSIPQTTSFSILYEQFTFRPNPKIIDGRLRSISVKLSYDTKQLINVGMFTIIDRSKDSREVTLNVEHSNPSILTSDFRFTKFSLVCKQYQSIGKSMSIDVHFRGGYSLGSLPPQRLFDIIAGSSGFTVDGILRTVDDKEFSGDKLAILQIDYNFGSLPFRLLGIPYLKSTDLIAYFGSAWTDVSASSSSIQINPVMTTPKLLHEAGFGIGRLLSFFRLDFTWRLTKRVRENFRLTLGSEIF